MDDEERAHRRAWVRPLTLAAAGCLLVLAVSCLPPGGGGALPPTELEARRRMARELIRRQEGIARIERALDAQSSASRRALKLVLALAPLPPPPAPQAGNATNCTVAPNATLPARQNSTNATSASAANATLNASQTENSTQADKKNPLTPVEQRFMDEYAEVRAAVRTRPSGVRLKEQAVDEYTADRVRCFPMNDKGEVAEVTHSASFCWYHPRFCQLLCEPRGAEDGYASARRYNDPGTPRGNAWAQWNAILKGLAPRS